MLSPLSPMDLADRVQQYDDVNGSFRAAALLVLSASLPACQNYLFDQKCPEAVTETTRSVVVDTPVPVDILFVVDNSGSMADEQENLVRNFDAFIQVIAGSNLDYRIAVVSTDMGRNNIEPNGPEVEGIAGFDVIESSPFRPVDTNDRSDCREIPGLTHGCFRGGRSEPWIDSTRDDAATVRSAFASAARVGTCGSGAERGTTAMLAALDNTRAGGCNAGFLRAEANLVLVFVSDEDDFQALAAPELLSRLSAFKPIQRVRVAVIGGFVDGTPSRCRGDTVGDVTATCGSLCDMPRPPADDQGACGMSCGRGYECSNLGGRNRCVSIAYLSFPNGGTGFGCDSCSSFDVADCCAADGGATDYLAFATAVENEVARLEPTISASGCQGGTAGGRPACLVDSICQNEFAETLQRIARDLVVTNTVMLDPPASYPPGVVAILRGGRFPDGRNLELDTDFTVSSDGTRLDITNGELLPREGEDLDVFFTVENTVDAPQVGACQ